MKEFWLIRHAESMGNAGQKTTLCPPGIIWPRKLSSLTGLVTS